MSCKESNEKLTSIQSHDRTPDENSISKPNSTINVQKTPVSLLQELYVRQGITPKYDLVQIEGAVHEPTFKYRVTVGDAVATGKGTSKKSGKSEAARAFLYQVYSQCKPSMEKTEIISESSLCSLFEKTAIINGTDAKKSNTRIQASNDIQISSDVLLKADLKKNDNTNNPISALQELLSKRSMPLPIYEFTVEEGPAHDRLFYIRCQVGTKYSTQGIGRSKKIAKKDSACKMLKRFETCISNDMCVRDADVKNIVNENKKNEVY